MILIISLFSSMSNEFMRSVMSSSFCNSMTAAHQAPLSVGFPRQEYWSGLPFPSPGDLPNTRIKPMSPAYRHSWPAEPLGKSPAQISHQIPISLRISVKILIVGHKTSDDIVLLNSWLHLLLSSLLPQTGSLLGISWTSVRLGLCTTSLPGMPPPAGPWFNIHSLLVFI